MGNAIGNAWYADSEWPPVFAVLSGIVFNASRRIPEGAWVTLDEDKGVVEWE